MNTHCRFPSPMPNFNFSRNSLKYIEIKRWCKKSIQSECKDHEILAIYTKLPVLHEIEGIEDIKVLFLGKHLLKNIQVTKETMKKKQQDVLKIDYQSVSHEVDPWSSSGYVVEWVSRLRREYQTEFRSKLDYHNISRSIIITSPW